MESDSPSALATDEPPGAAGDMPSCALPPGELVRFELQPKDSVVNLRLSAPLLNALRARAKEERVPCQRLIRLALERMLRDSQSS